MERIVVVMMEDRSFDHLLGWMLPRISLRSGASPERMVWHPRFDRDLLHARIRETGRQTFQFLLAGKLVTRGRQVSGNVTEEGQDRWTLRRLPTDCPCC
jgi:hypothetical protein